MQTCKQCGQRINKAMKFCPCCGAAMDDIEDRNDKRVSTNDSKEKKSIGKKAIVVVVAIVIILGIVAVSSTLLFQQKSSLIGNWKLSGYLEGSSGGLNLDLPDVNLNVSDESFEMHVKGEQGIVMLFGVGGSDPVDLTIGGTFSLAEKTTEGESYKIVLTSIYPSEEMLENLEAIYGSEMNSVSLRDVFSKRLETALAELGRYEIELHVPNGSLDPESRDATWLLRLTDPQGLEEEFGLLFTTNGDKKNSFRAFVNANGESQVVNEGSWDLLSSKQLALSFPYSDTDVGMAHVSITHETD